MRIFIEPIIVETVSGFKTMVLAQDFGVYIGKFSYKVVISELALEAPSTSARPGPTHAASAGILCSGGGEQETSESKRTGQGIVPSELMAIRRLEANILARIEAWCSLYDINGFFSGPGGSLSKARRIGSGEGQSREGLEIGIRRRAIVINSFSIRQEKDGENHI